MATVVHAGSIVGPASEWVKVGDQLHWLPEQYESGRSGWLGKVGKEMQNGTRQQDGP